MRGGELFEYLFMAYIEWQHPAAREYFYVLFPTREFVFHFEVRIL